MRTLNHCRGAKWVWVVLKSPKKATCTSFNAVNVLLKNLRCEYGDAKLASCLGRHLTLLRPCVYQYWWYELICFKHGA